MLRKPYLAPVSPEMRYRYMDICYPRDRHMPTPSIMLETTFPTASTSTPSRVERLKFDFHTGQHGLPRRRQVAFAALQHLDAPFSFQQRVVLAPAPLQDVGDDGGRLVGVDVRVLVPRRLVEGQSRTQRRHLLAEFQQLTGDFLEALEIDEKRDRRATPPQSSVAEQPLRERVDALLVLQG